MINEGRPFDGTVVSSLGYADGSPLGIKRERSAGDVIAQCCGCPRNCERQIFRLVSTGI